MNTCVQTPEINNEIPFKHESYLIALSALNQEVKLLQIGNVVVQKDYRDCSIVRVVSGGVSCAHSQYVGKGMLTAAIQGQQNDGPTPKLILRTIRELALNQMCVLIIVQGFSTDTLNFGLAVERAINDGLQVNSLIVSEGIENKDLGITQKRGMGGIILVTKIAGAMAEENNSMPEIIGFCEKVVDNMTSSGMVVQSKQESSECSVCRVCKSHISNTQHTEGLKEAQVFQILIQLFSDIIDTEIFNVNTEELSLVILINNISGLKKCEEPLFIKELLTWAKGLAITIERIYIDHYITVPYNIDISMTVLRVFDTKVLRYLDVPSTAPGWKNYNQKHSISMENIMDSGLRRKQRLTSPIRGPSLTDKEADVLMMCTQFACDALISCENQLNIIDRERGDGDTGTRLKVLSEVMLKRLKSNKVVTNYPFTFFEGLSRILETAVGSTLGCIYSIMFEAAANKFMEYNESDAVHPMMWLEALEAAVVALRRYGNVQFGSGTMYDPIHVCAEVIREQLAHGKDQLSYLKIFENGVYAAEKTAQQTKVGNYKCPDSGAHAVGIWMRAVFEGAKLRLAA